MSVTQRLRDMAAHDRGLQRAAEDRHWLGERTDPEDLDDDTIDAELRAGDTNADAALAEARARHLTSDRDAVRLMMDAGRADAAWGRRRTALLTEKRRRTRIALDARTTPRVRGRALRLRQVWLTNGGDRTRSDTPPRYLTWDDLPLHEASAWAALAIETADRAR